MLSSYLYMQPDGSITVDSVLTLDVLVHLGSVHLSSF
jgi:hypothetical protein